MTALILLIASLLQINLYSCSFKSVLHIACPGCGLTRSIQNVLAGDLASALKFHLFGPLALVGIGMMVFVSMAPEKQVARLCQTIESVETRWMVTQILFLLFLGYWLVRWACLPEQFGSL